MIDGPQPQHSSVALGAVISALDSAVVSVVEAEGTTAPDVSTVAIVDSAELSQMPDYGTSAELMLLVGADEHVLIDWLIRSESADASCPVFVVKESCDSPRLRAALAASSLIMIVIDDDARWEAMYALVVECLHRHRIRSNRISGADPSARFDDLFQLAEAVAQSTGGLVSIEDGTESRVLAYSPSHGAADELRTRTILGREPDSEALQVYRRDGVIRTIRSSTEVVNVPSIEDHGLQPRLVAGIHSPDGMYIGSLWVQRGRVDFLPDSETVVQGAAVSAAEIILEEMQIPSMTEMTAHKLFGQYGGTDAEAAANRFNIDADSEVAVVGLSPAEGQESAFFSTGRLVLLHAKAFSSRAVVAMFNGRGYVLLPDYKSTTRLQEWVDQLIKRFDGLSADRTCALRAAIASPVHGLSGVAVAREEIDQVLAGPVELLPRVTTLQESRTAVLLDQIRSDLRTKPKLRDPRLVTVADYDREHGTGLIDSLREYFSTGGNVSRSAGRMNVHPNTLHYRLERAQRIAGLRFDNARDRLLTALQVTVFDFDEDNGDR